MTAPITTALETPRSKGAGAAFKPAFCILKKCDIELWGQTPAARFRRAFPQAGLGQEITPDELGKYKHPVVVVRADAVIDMPLLAVLAKTAGLVLTGSHGFEGERLAVHAPANKAKSAARLLAERAGARVPSGFRQLSPETLEVAYWSKLRKREVPYAVIVDAGNLNSVHWRMFMGTYKGATDFVTKHIWPVPAFHITRAIAPLKITPNMVTALSAVFVVAAYLLFEQGAWTLGLIAAWLMALLDTVDGKLARVTLTSSKWGDIFDHGIDLIHPPFWYAAWAFGLAHSDHALSLGVMWWTLGVIFGGYILQRLIEGIAIKIYRLEIHVWRPIDTAFRQITARRNPNMAILTVSAVIGRPDLGLLAVAAWIVICLIAHSIQIIQAHRSFGAHGELSSWLAAKTRSHGTGKSGSS